MRSAGVSARRRPRGGDDSTGFASTPPGHRLPVPAVGGVHRPAGDVGPALAGAWRTCPVARRASRADRHPEMVRQVGAGGAGDRQRNRHIDAGDGQDRAGYRCGRRRGLPARAGPAAQRDRSGSGHQYPAGPRRRSRRAGAHVRIRVADRGAGVLPRPVAQGASPQAQAAAIGRRRLDRRPAAPRRCPARRHGPRGVRRADRGGRRRRTAAEASHRRPRPARLCGAADHQIRDEGARRGERRRGTALGEAARR